MRAPKCKVCGVEHWGVCYQPARSAPPEPQAAKPAAKKSPKPKARKAK